MGPLEDRFCALFAERKCESQNRLIVPAMKSTPSKRDRVLLEVAYAGGLRVSELVALAWADVLPRDATAAA